MCFDSFWVTSLRVMESLSMTFSSSWRSQGVLICFVTPRVAGEPSAWQLFPRSVSCLQERDGNYRESHGRARKPPECCQTPKSYPTPSRQNQSGESVKSVGCGCVEEVRAMLKITDEVFHTSALAQNSFSVLKKSKHQPCFLRSTHLQVLSPPNI